MTKQSLLFPSKLRRSKYLVRWLIWLVALGLSVALLIPLGESFEVLSIAVFVCALVFKAIALDIPRLRDAGMSPFLLLLLILPVANLVIVGLLFFAPTKEITNAPPALPTDAKTTSKGIRALQILGVLGGIGLTAVVLLGLSINAGFLPDTAALRGKDISQTALKDLRELGVLQETETVLFFYSGGFLSFKEDGNFFTETRTVSYSFVDDELWLGEARFEDIAEIEFEKKRGFAEDSIITIFPKERRGSISSFQTKTKKTRSSMPHWNHNGNSRKTSSIVTLTRNEFPSPPRVS